MPDRVVLHIGAPKTGTTYLQSILFSNQQRLREHGVLVPLADRYQHGNAAAGLRQGRDGRQWAMWERLVDEALAWDGTVVISNEWFSMVGPQVAASAVEALGAPRLHVVFTARDLVEQVPAAWQETLKLGTSSSLEAFVKGLDRRHGRWRWSVLDPARVLSRWARSLPVDQLHVLTVPPKGSDTSVLWPRFAELSRIEPGWCDTSVTNRRESIGIESARLLQLLGPALRDAVHADEPGMALQAYRWIQSYLSHQILVPAGGGRVSLTPDLRQEIRARSRVSIQRLREAGYDVVGSLDELSAAIEPDTVRQAEDVTSAELFALAETIIPVLLGRVRAEALRAEAAEAQLRGDDGHR